MPPYTEKLVSESELTDIRAFLETRPRAAAIDALVPK